MHWNGDDMYTMRKLGWVSLLAAAVAMGGCDDEEDDTSTTVATTATMTDTETSSTDTDTPDTTGDADSDSEGESSSGGSVDCSAAPSYATDIQPLWDANGCITGCHEPGGSWPSTDLTAAMGYDMLVDADGIQTMALTDVQLVIPGDTENSYLLNKLNGTQEMVAGAAAGTQMPQGLPPMSAGDIATVEQWIACGAEM